MEQTTAIEEVQPETKKMIINRPSANRERIKQDEAELAALMEKDKVVEEVTEETDENLSKEE